MNKQQKLNTLIKLISSSPCKYRTDDKNCCGPNNFYNRCIDIIDMSLPTIKDFNSQCYNCHSKLINIYDKLFKID